jgi:N utilization substance protein A
VFAANALSPAKVSQVRITDIETRGMTVIVGEDQLSLAIGKKGQNVRLATRLVGWDIKIVSEEVLKKEIAQQMGRMIASGEAVPITELEGVTPSQADVLAEHGIEDIEKLAAASVDDLSEYLNVSMDEAESILTSARAIVAAKEEGKEVAEEEAAPAENTAEVSGGEDTGSSEAAEPPVEDVAAEEGTANGATAAESTEASADSSEQDASVALTSNEAGAEVAEESDEPSTEETAA